MSERNEGQTTFSAHRVISALPLGCGGILAAFLGTTCSLAALIAAASWIFGLNELHQVVVAAAAVVTTIVIATQVVVSFMLFDFTEDIEKEDDDA